MQIQQQKQQKKMLTLRKSQINLAKQGADQLNSARGQQVNSPPSQIERLPPPSQPGPTINTIKEVGSASKPKEKSLQTRIKRQAAFSLKVLIDKNSEGMKAQIKAGGQASDSEIPAKKKKPERKPKSKVSLQAAAAFVEPSVLSSDPAEPQQQIQQLQEIQEG